MAKPPPVVSSALSRLALVAALAVVTRAPILQAQDPLPSDVSFAIRRAWLEDLLTGGPGGRTVGLRWAAEMKMGERSNVHGLSADCELHVAARLPNNRLIAAPRGLVVEPPNVCRRRVPQISQTGAIGDAWTAYFDANVKDETCTVTGFPRIFTEHSAGGGGSGSNPDHVVEVHPVSELRCGADTINFVPLIRIFAGMRKIQANSARTCLEDRTLEVRQRGSGDQIRYEFAEAGAKGSGGSCGNFAVLDAHIGKDYLREMTNGGDYAALAQAWIGDSGPFPLKVYAYKGTAVGDSIAALLANPDDLAELRLSVHGLFTYDYFTIAQTIQDDARQWLPADSLKVWKPVPKPLAFVIYGLAQP
jgi:hypothetical protein